MQKYCSGLLLAGIFASLVVSSNCWPAKTVEKASDEIMINKVVTTIIENCDLGLQSIIVYGDKNCQSIFEAISKLKIPVSKLLMLGHKMDDDFENFYDVENQGFVLITNTHRDNFLYYNEIIFEWRCKKNCTLIIVPQPNDNCDHASINMIFAAKMAIHNAYYVCPKKNRFFVFTYNVYGDTKPAYWGLLKQITQRSNPWYLYARIFEEESICQGFLFERSKITRNNSILIGVRTGLIDRKKKSLLQDGFYGTEVEKYMEEAVEEVNDMKKLMRVEFTYYFRDTSKYEEDRDIYQAHIFERVLADVSYAFSSASDHKLYRNRFVPTLWGSCAIFSHNQGLRTPLEKISHFYGVWSISSLIVISMLTFIVIWYKMRRNIAFAAFDVIRLLIDGGVNVPINTLSLKIFFSMVFLYFMVIQATFSGNLSKFLTIPEYRKNIDSFEDLKDPRITTIYCSNVICDRHEILISLHDKIVIVDNAILCARYAQIYPDSVCIDTSQNLKIFYVNNIRSMKFYVSKPFEPFGGSYTYRKQFILQEQFNKALMYMNEIELAGRSRKKFADLLEGIIAKYEARSEINFRAITLEDLKFAFIFLIVGNSLSIVCFIIELIIDRKKKSLKNYNCFNIFKRKQKSLKIKISKITVQPATI